MKKATKEDVLKSNNEIVEILLKDRTTNQNIIWATEQVHFKGTPELREEKITLKHIYRIKPRAEKSKAERERRSKDNAEVFTPSWIINKQNNLVDRDWFDKNEGFSVEGDDHTYKVAKRINFKSGINWQNYVTNIRLEACCGEAPYLANRYDTVSGDVIPLENRIGILDRKFRVVKENAKDDNEWLEYSKRAMQATYGYEFQGDNLFIARTNLMHTYIDYYQERFKEIPTQETLIEIATIVSWNLWQMDGLKLVVPYSCHNEPAQVSLFSDLVEEKEEGCPGCLSDNPKEHNGTRCVIMDWEKNKKTKYISLMWGKWFEK